MQTNSKKGFLLRSILLHSSWITIAGILLFRLATANTQTAVYAEILEISGVVIATAPWIIQLVVSTAIIFLYRAKVCDLMWLVRLPSDETTCCQNIKILEEAIRGSFRAGTSTKLSLPPNVHASNNPRLKRNRTI